MIYKHPLRQGETIRIAPFKDGYNPGNPSQKPPPYGYQLASIIQLRGSITVLDDDQIRTMEELDFHCQHNGHGPCYRLDDKTGKKIYYICFKDADYCYDIELIDENGHYTVSKR